MSTCPGSASSLRGERPRKNDANAATRAIAAAAVNTMTRPCEKAEAMVRGKKSVPVRMATLCSGSVARVPLGGQEMLHRVVSEERGEQRCRPAADWRLRARPRGRHPLGRQTRRKRAEGRRASPVIIS